MTTPSKPSRMGAKDLHIIGGGLAGSEAAWQAAQMGVRVILHEMRRWGSLVMPKSGKGAVPVA